MQSAAATPKATASRTVPLELPNVVCYHGSLNDDENDFPAVLWCDADCTSTPILSL